MMKQLSRPARLVALLLAGFTISVLLRLVIGGVGAPDSVVAGLVFALCLGALAAYSRTPLPVSRRSIVVGLAGTTLLLLVPFAYRLAGAPPHPPAGNFIVWAIVVSAVAGAEEWFLRGSLFDAARRWRGTGMALFVSALAFSLLHVPLYGWSAAPLDFVVGLWMGELRILARSPVAPGISHILADLAGWWLR